MDLFPLIPLTAALVYTVGTLFVKQSSSHGIGPWRTTFVANVVNGVLAVPFWFIGPSFESWGELIFPVVVSLMFFGGQLLTCLAIHKGDVSVFTPLMGIKTVFVGILAIWVVGEQSSMAIWVAVFLSAVAIFLLRGKGHAERERLLPSIVFGVGSAFCFAVYDTLMQRFGGDMGFERMVSATFSFNALWSLALIPLFKAPVSRIEFGMWKGLVVGSALLAVQSIGMAIALSRYGRVTEANIFYSSRGIWSVALVFLMGHWFGNSEASAGKKVMATRLLGAFVLAGAIFIAVVFQ